MKKIVGSTAIALLLMIDLASTTFAAPAAAETQLLLKGSFDATETHQDALPYTFVDAVGVGNATQLGLFTYHLQAILFLPTLTANTSATLTAANGDMIFGEGSGQGTLTGTPGIVSILETYTITGGTGRFASATGNFTVERVINRATFASTGTILGTIVIS